ncbi:Hypothetical_protein [Hexamita inflata]|uniref:Hypothetical_protein n=1 Tax=Hexamita inflata TaxID=28002 RepID=A0AA86U2N2_9EUKA|nr:Hypothetical protein HINF_LOCUS25784 [Hexamita inflata]
MQYNYNIVTPELPPKPTYCHVYFPIYCYYQIYKIVYLCNRALICLTNARLFRAHDVRARYYQCIYTIINCNAAVFAINICLSTKINEYYRQLRQNWPFFTISPFLSNQDQESILSLRYHSSNLLTVSPEQAFPNQ